jgi:hypothetical protein
MIPATLGAGQTGRMLVVGGEGENVHKYQLSTNIKCTQISMKRRKCFGGAEGAPKEVDCPGIEI